MSIVPLAAVRAEMEVICVARRPMEPTYPHDVISGVEAILAGVAYSDSSALVECEWEFGDGTRSGREPVDDPQALEAKHVYTASVGRVFRAVLTVWDETGTSASDSYYVRVCPDTLRSRARMSCDSALWNLHKRMNRYEVEGVPSGHWSIAYDSHRVGITAACVQAFENLGNFPFDDADESPYVDDVRRGLNQLLLQMKAEAISPQSAGNPDGNGNGIGLFCHHGESIKHIFSNHGLAMMALVMSRDPQRVAPCGGSYVNGRTLVDIVQDMVDFVAYGQTDDNPGEIVARGGWRYEQANSGEADMACTEWPVCGSMLAERNWAGFGVSVPSWVKTELRENFLAADQDGESGGWRYRSLSTERVNVGLTGIGLACCAWVGLPYDDPTVQSGLGYLAANWDSDGQFGHFTSMFNMFAIANAMRAYGSDAIGEHDWYREYVERLAASQSEDGGWTSEGYEESWPITTAWAVLILLRPQTPPSVEIDAFDDAQQGDVNISYRLFDDNYDECDVVAEFSTDGRQSWSPASQVGGDGLTGVEASPEGLPRCFVWDTVTDLGKANVDNVLFRLAARDGEEGEPAETVLPGVYNDIVPFERVEIANSSANGRGVSLADFDGDGDLDVFVANFGQGNFLFRNESGVLVETASSAGMGGSFPSTCGVWGDFNGDGAIDLYLVLSGEPNRLYASNGEGTFTEVAPALSADDAGGGTSAAWADYDGDNLLDLYVANDSTIGLGLNALYHNEGVGGFVNVAVALKVDCRLRSRAVSWSDFDRDGNIDLYVANGGVQLPVQTNALFQNVSISFLDVAEDAGVSDTRVASAVVWGDFNDDGFPDIYLVNSGVDGNALFVNNGDETFRDETVLAGVEGPPNARGAAAADFDNDGDLDIFVSADGRNCLYVNRGNCTFVEAASLAGVAENSNSRGAAWGDINGDGFLDLYVVHSGSNDVLFLNGRSEGNWLRVCCLTDSDGDATDEVPADDRDAIGAVIEVDLDGDMDFSSAPPDRLEIQCVDGGSGYMSQGQLWPHFGLGRSRGADVRVTFPDGSVVYECSVSANQTVTVRDIAPRGDFYARVFTPQSPASRRVPIGYVVFSPAEVSCEVKVEYSLDEGETWKPVLFMGAGGDGTSELASSPRGVLHSYVWDSVAELGGTNYETVRIRITPFISGPDGAVGQPGETRDFSVHNNTAPEVVVETPPGESSGNVLIYYTLADIQGDACTIFVEYFTNSTNRWRIATRGDGGDLTYALSSSPEGTPHVYCWDSVANVGRTVQDGVKIRITPSDTQHGLPGESGAFVLDNNSSPSAAIQTPASAQKGDVPLDYQLFDAEGDACSIEVLYSLDGGRTWSPASMASGGDGVTGLQSAAAGQPHTFVWDSGRDFGNDYSAIVRATIIPRDAETGQPGQTGDFTVDNLRPAELAFSPRSFAFSAQEGGEPPDPQTLLVWNQGSHSLEWKVASDAGWLIVHPLSGISSGEQDNVEVSADITGLGAGTYSTNITLSAPGVLGSPATIPVVLEISPPPSSLYVAESLLSYRLEKESADPAPQYIHIRNEGGGSMPWQAQADHTWISLDATSGSSSGETDTVAVRVVPGELPVGSHSASITISAPGALNSPHVVEVSLEVLPAPPKLLVSPAELTFVTRRGGPNPPQQDVVLRASGDSEVTWETHHEATWLSLNPASGKNSGEETAVHLAVEKAGLYIGSYETEVTFSAVGVAIAPQKVSVVLQIVPIVVPDDFPSIQEAIDDAQNLDVVQVQPGYYAENIVMKDGVELIGSGADVTTIHPESATSAVVFQGIRSSLLEGFTVSGGAGDFFLGRESRAGGGIYSANSIATVSQCNISSNSASWGGGICADNGSRLAIAGCSISGNSADGGAGIFCYENCQVTLLQSRLFDNSAYYFGGGANADSGSLIAMRSSLIFGNSARLGGGGIYARTGASLDMVSCTVCDNEGEGILADSGSSVAVANTILWSNSTDLDIPAGQEVRCCDIGSDDYVGTNGNISENPSFLAPEESCYDLLPNSPCIDAGADMPELPDLDIHGEPRVVAVHGAPMTDIGADEHNPDMIFVLVQAVPERGSGAEVTVPYTLWNARSLPASVVVEYSIGGYVWNPAARADGDATVNLASSPGGSPHEFVWDFVPDLKGQTAKSVRIRIRLRNQDVRPGATTAPFSLTDSPLWDSDNDGLPDAWEQALVDADPDIDSIADVTPTGDLDGDSSRNLTEYLARTDPIDPGSIFKASCLPGEAGAMIVRWTSVEGRIYQLYMCENLGGEWIPIGPPQQGTGLELFAMDGTVAESVKYRYYTVRVE